MFQAIDADLQHPSSDDMLFAAMNLVLELLGIAVMSLAIASQPQILRQVGKALLALCFYVVVLAATYDTVAQTLCGAPRAKP